MTVLLEFEKAKRNASDRKLFIEKSFAALRNDSRNLNVENLNQLLKARLEIVKNIYLVYFSIESSPNETALLIENFARVNFGGVSDSELPLLWRCNEATKETHETILHLAVMSCVNCLNLWIFTSLTITSVTRLLDKSSLASQESLAAAEAPQAADDPKTNLFEVDGLLKRVHTVIESNTPQTAQFSILFLAWATYLGCLQMRSRVDNIQSHTFLKQLLDNNVDSQLLLQRALPLKCFQVIESTMKMRVYSVETESLTQVLIGLLTAVPRGFEVTILPHKFEFFRVLAQVLALNPSASTEFWSEIDLSESLPPTNFLYLPQLVFPYFAEPLLYLLSSICRSELAAVDVFNYFSRLRDFAIALNGADESLFVVPVALGPHQKSLEWKPLGFVNQDVSCPLFESADSDAVQWKLPQGASVFPLPFVSGVSVIRAPYSGWHCTLSLLEAFLTVPNGGPFVSAKSWGVRNDTRWSEASSHSPKPAKKPLFDVAAVLDLWKSTLQYGTDLRRTFMDHLLSHVQTANADHQVIIKLIVDIIVRVSSLCAQQVSVAFNSKNGAFLCIEHGIGVLEQWLPLYSDSILPYMHSWLHDGVLARMWMLHEQKPGTYGATSAFIRLVKRLALLVTRGDIPASPMAASCLQLGIRRIRVLVFDALDTWRFSNAAEKFTLLHLCLDLFSVFAKTMKGELPGQSLGQEYLASVYLEDGVGSSYLPVLRLFASAELQLCREQCAYVPEVEAALFSAVNFVKKLLQWDRFLGRSTVESHLLELSSDSHSCELVPVLASLLTNSNLPGKLLTTLADMLTELVSVSRSTKTAVGLVEYLGADSKQLCEFLVQQLNTPRSGVQAASLQSSYWKLASRLLATQPSLSLMLLETKVDSNTLVTAIESTTTALLANVGTELYMFLLDSFCAFLQILWQHEAHYFFFIKIMAFNEKFKRDAVDLFSKALEVSTDQAILYADQARLARPSVIVNELDLGLRISKFMLCEKFLELFAKWALSSVLPRSMLAMLLQNKQLWNLLLDCPDPHGVLASVERLLAGSEAVVKCNPWYSYPGDVQLLLDDSFKNFEKDTSDPSNLIYNWQAVYNRNKHRPTSEWEFLVKTAIEFNTISALSLTHWRALVSWSKLLLPEAKNLDWDLVETVLASLCRHCSGYSKNHHVFNLALCEILLFALKALPQSADAKRQRLLSGLSFVLIEECKDTDSAAIAGGQFQNLLVSLLELISSTEMSKDERFAQQLIFDAFSKLFAKVVKQCNEQQWQNEELILIGDLLAMLQMKLSAKLPQSLWLREISDRYSRQMESGLFDFLESCFIALKSCGKKAVSDFAVHVIELHAFWANCSSAVGECLLRSSSFFRSFSVLAPLLPSSSADLKDAKRVAVYDVWLSGLKCINALLEPGISPIYSELDLFVQEFEKRVFSLAGVDNAKGKVLLQEINLWADLFGTYFSSSYFRSEPQNPFHTDLLSRQMFRESASTNEENLLCTQTKIEERFRLLKWASTASAALLQVTTPETAKACRGMVKLQRCLWRLDALVYLPIEQTLYYIESLHLSLCPKDRKTSLQDTFAFLTSSDAELYILSLGAATSSPSFGTLFKLFSLAVDVLERHSDCVWPLEMLESCALLLLETYLFHWFLPHFKINLWIQEQAYSQPLGQLSVSSINTGIDWKHSFVEHGILATYKTDPEFGSLSSANDDFDQMQFAVPFAKRQQTSALRTPASSNVQMTPKSAWNAATPRHFSASKWSTAKSAPSLSPAVSLSSKKRSALNQQLSVRSLNRWAHVQSSMPPKYLEDMKNYRHQLFSVIQPEIAAHFDRAEAAFETVEQAKSVKPMFEKIKYVLESVSRVFPSL